MNYVKVWAHDLAQQEGKGGPTDQGEGIPSVLVVLVAGQTGQWRSRTAATVAGTPGLQRADAVPEMVARMLGPRWCSTERSLLRPPGCGAARRADEENRPRPRARRLQAVGQGACGQGQFSPAYLLVANFTCVGRAVTLQREKIEGKEDII